MTAGVHVLYCAITCKIKQMQYYGHGAAFYTSTKQFSKAILGSQNPSGKIFPIFPQKEKFSNWKT